MLSAIPGVLLMNLHEKMMFFNELANSTVSIMRQLGLVNIFPTNICTIIFSKRKGRKGAHQ